MICGLIGGPTIAIRRESETLFVHGQIKTLNASPQAIELNPRCYGQAHSKGIELALGIKTCSTDVRLKYSALYP